MVHATKIFPRSEIIMRLDTERNRARPILAAGASAGIIAKCASIAGADLLVVYSTGRSRLMGLPTFRLGDSNLETIRMAGEILNVVESTPVIGGIEATDPTRRDLSRLIDDFLAAGYSGIINFPTVAMWSDYRTLLEKKGYGFDLECELIAECRRREIFTMAYVFSPEDAEKMVRSGTDCVIAHAGPTEGGLVGPKYDETFDYALKSLQEIFDASRDVRGDVFCLGHGGPFESPATVQEMYRRTTAEGFVGASSIERIPIERAITQVVTDFKNLDIESSGEYGEGRDK